MELALLVLAAALFAKLRACPRTRDVVPVRSLPTRSPRTVSDSAFDYERALLDIDIDELTRGRWLWLSARVIVPTAGLLRVDEISAEVAAGVKALLAARATDEHVRRLWRDMLSFGGYGPQEGPCAGATPRHDRRRRKRGREARALRPSGRAAPI